MDLTVGQQQQQSPPPPASHSRHSSPDGHQVNTALPTLGGNVMPAPTTASSNADPLTGSFQKFAPQDNWNDPPSLLAAVRANNNKPALSGSARQLDSTDGGQQQQLHAFNNNLPLNTSPYSSAFTPPLTLPPYGGNMSGSIPHSASYPNLTQSTDHQNAAADLTAAFPPPVSFEAPENVVVPPPFGGMGFLGGETTFNRFKATIANSFRNQAANAAKVLLPTTTAVISAPPPPEYSVTPPSQQQPSFPPQKSRDFSAYPDDTVDSGNSTHHSSISAIDSLDTLQAIWYYQTLQSAVDEIKPAWVPFTPPETRKLEYGYHMWLSVRGKTSLLDGSSAYAEKNNHLSMQQQATDRITGEDNIKHASGAVDTSNHHLCSVFGGRHDVDYEQMQLLCVFWDEPPRLVLRATWFYKGATETSFLPYDQAVCLKFEEHYQRTWRLGTWHSRIDIGNGEALVIHSPNAISHFVQPEQSAAVWVTVPDALLRPRAVRRSAEGVHIDYPSSSGRGTMHAMHATSGQTSSSGGFATFPPPASEVSATTSNSAAQFYDSSYDVDHLVFVVHGIGSVCDLKMRNVIECVGNLRQISRSLLLEHWRDYLEQNQIHRVEFLPIEWHSKLHGETTGVDERLKTITLPSIPKLRNFTNETLLDILFYTSPTYCQTIAETVAFEINRLHALYRQRNPRFCGKVSIIGHSLGSLIVFDLLANQQRPPPVTTTTVPAAGGVGNGVTGHGVDASFPAVKPPLLSTALSVPDILVPSSENDNADFFNNPCTLEDLITRSGVLSSAADSETLMTVEKYAEKLRTDAGVRTVEDVMLLTENDFDKLNIPLVQRRRLILAASSVLPGGRIAQLRRHHWLEQQHQFRRNEPKRRSSSLAVRGSSLIREKFVPHDENPNLSVESYQLDPDGAWRSGGANNNMRSSEVSLYSGGAGSSSVNGGVGVTSSISEPNLSTILKQMSTLAVNYTVSTDANNGGVGQPSVYYPKLSVEPECFFAIGSPIGMFLTVRGVKNIGIDYKLPTCARFMNLFHPYDVVAYRVEPLIRPDLHGQDSLPAPVQLPHHKGRKRYHRQLQEHMGTVTAGLKTRLVDNIWSTLTSWPFGGATANGKPPVSESDKVGQLHSTSVGEALMNAAVHVNTRLSSDAPAVVADPGTAQSMGSEGPPSAPNRVPDMTNSPYLVQSVPPPPPMAAADSINGGGVTLGGPASALAASLNTSLIPNDTIATTASSSSTSNPAGSAGNIDMGQLNEGNRVDYVLQESALESVNQYLFAFHAHTCYWDSEDTIFMILMELYGKDGFMPRQFPHAMAGGSHMHHHQLHQNQQNFGGAMPSSGTMHAPPPPQAASGVFPPPLSTSPFGMPPLHGSNQFPLLPGAAYATGSIAMNNNRSPVPVPPPPSFPAGSSPPPPPLLMARPPMGITGPPPVPPPYGGSAAPMMPLAPPSMMQQSTLPWQHQ